MGQRPNELTPHENLQHYWGAELRALRTQRGMALADLAHQVHCDPSYLGKIERAERTISPDLAASCDTALGAHGTLIRLHTLTESDRELAPKTPDQPPIHEDSNTPDEDNHPSTLTNKTVLLAGADTGEEVIVPLRAADGRIVLVPVPRRLFLQGLGTTALSLAAIPATAPHSPPTAFSTATDVNPVEHFRQMLQVLSDNDRLFGPWRVIPMVREQIDIIQQLRSRWSGTDQRELVRVQAEYTEFHGWLCQDAGKYQLAESCIDRAFALSQIAEDQNLAAHIMARRADLACDTRVPVDAIGAAEQALRIAPPRSRIAAISPAYAAHGYALSGDVNAMERAYDQARELLQTSDAAAEGSHPAPWFDEKWIALRRAQSLSVLGNYHHAAQSYQDAIADLPLRYRRGRGVWLARAALTLTRTQEADQATALGLEALTIGAETSSARILTELARLNEALDTWSTVPAVVDFRTAMRDTVVHRV